MRIFYTVLLLLYSGIAAAYSTDNSTIEANIYSVELNAAKQRSAIKVSLFDENNKPFYAGNCSDVTIERKAGEDPAIGRLDTNVYVSSQAHNNNSCYTYFYPGSSADGNIPGEVIVTAKVGGELLSGDEREITLTVVGESEVDTTVSVTSTPSELPFGFSSQAIYTVTTEDSSYNTIDDIDDDSDIVDWSVDKGYIDLNTGTITVDGGVHIGDVITVTGVGASGTPVDGKADTALIRVVAPDLDQGDSVVTLDKTYVESPEAAQATMTFSFNSGATPIDAQGPDAVAWSIEGDPHGVTISESGLINTTGAEIGTYVITIKGTGKDLSQVNPNYPDLSSEASTENITVENPTVIPDKSCNITVNSAGKITNISVKGEYLWEGGARNCVDVAGKYSRCHTGLELTESNSAGQFIDAYYDNLFASRRVYTNVGVDMKSTWNNSTSSDVDYDQIYSSPYYDIEDYNYVCIAYHLGSGDITRANVGLDTQSCIPINEACSITPETR